MNRWDLLKKKQHSVIGMLHMKPLPGSPLYKGDLKAIVEHVKTDAKALIEGGVHALMMENFGDVPFSATQVGVETVAVMAMIATEVRRLTDLPIGINVLRNDAASALAIAVASDADFIRVNVLSGARVTDQGVIQGQAYDLMRMRSRLDTMHIGVMADVDVKHSAALAPRSLQDEVDDTVKRGLADALIVSGAGTGKQTPPDKVTQVAQFANGVPVYLGSGITVDNVRNYLTSANGFIVGTHFKAGGAVDAAVNPSRVKAFMKALNN